MVAVLGHEHVRQQRRPGQAALDRAAGREGLEDALAAHAGELGPYMADDLEAAGHVLELLGDVLADLAQLAAALAAGAGRPVGVPLGVVNPGLAWQVLGQLARIAARLA